MGHLGGSLCCESHTLAGFEYGTTVDNILALVAVMPNGEVVGTKSRYCGGYNLNQFFVRSEGTLGIVTEVKMRMHLLPEYTHNIGFTFDNFEQAIIVQNEMLKRRLSSLGIILAFDSTLHLFNVPGLQGAQGVLLMTVEGYREVVEIEEERISRIAAQGGGKALPSESADIVQDWWALLLGASFENAKKQTTSKVGPHIWVPRSLSIWAYRTFKTLASKYNLKYASALNGPTRLSIGVELNLDSAEEVVRFGGMIREYAAMLRERGGTIMGAHGCGLAFKDELRAEIGNGFNVMEKVKTALDPNGIMNPGKVF